MNTLYKDFRNFEERVEFNRNRTVAWDKDQPLSIAWLSNEKAYDRKDAYTKAQTLLPVKQSVARACKILHPFNDHVVAWGRGSSMYATDFTKDPIAVYLSGGILKNTALRFGFRTDVVFGGALHEICHVHYTKLWQKVIDKKDKLYHHLCNLLEDERIERLMRQELVGFGRYLDALDQCFIDKLHMTEEELAAEKERKLDNFAKKMSIVFKYVRTPHLLTPDEISYTDEITGANIIDTLHDIVKAKDLLKEQTVLDYAQEIMDRLFRSNDEQQKECEDHNMGENQQGDSDEIREQLKQAIKEKLKQAIKEELEKGKKEQEENNCENSDEDGDGEQSDTGKPTVGETDIDTLTIAIADAENIDEKAEQMADASMDIIEILSEISDNEQEGISGDVLDEMDAIEQRNSSRFNVEDMENKVSPYTMIIEDAKTNSTKYNRLKNEVARHAQALKRQMKFRDSEFKREIINRKEGKLNRRKLWTVQTGDPRPFKSVTVKKANKVDLAILMDLSGSMSGGYDSKIWKCQQVATLFAQAFKDVKTVNLSIYGHTTTERSGNEEILLLNYFSNRNKKLRPDTLGYTPSLQNNVDGYAIEKVGELLNKSATGNKQVLVVISDGQPCACRYSGCASINHTKRMTTKLKNRLKQTVVQVAIEESVPSEKMFDHYVTFSNLGTLVKDMTTLIKKIIR